MFDDSSMMQTINVLHQGLNTSSLRHEVISHNIANVNTPGYKSRRVNFETHLRSALRGEGELESITANPRHIHFGGWPDPSNVSASTVINDDLIYRNDGNSVDIDQETAILAKNTIMYNALSTRISGHFRLLRDAIRSGPGGV
ncbi:MAG: flagellar basal body rod protein FlgB [bacterium]|nr:flagellar basal body rod protein FlgB [bacterium]